MKSKTLFQSAVLCFCFLMALASGLSAQSGSITHVHDPCIIKDGDHYYIYSTGNRINMIRSSDLLSWQSIGSVFDELPAWGVQEVPGVSNIWAPDIFFHNGFYYLYYSLSTFGSNHSRIGLATNVTLDPENEAYNWIDQGKVIQSGAGDNFNAIDPNIVRDADNKIWMSFGSFWDGIRLVELDSTTGKPKQNYQLHSIASRSGGAIEAPFIVYKKGFYYLFVSFDFCCRAQNSTYNIRVGRSQNITGPYIDSNEKTMMSGGGTKLLAGDERWKGTGHCAILFQENADWLVFHAYDTENRGIPTLRILPLEWDTAGWPMVNPSLNIEEWITVPDNYSLYRNFPNPFNTITKIKFSLPHTGHVTLKVYDLLGKEVAVLLNQQKSAGTYTEEFNAAPLSSGIYMYVLQAGKFSAAKKMVFIK